MAFDPYTLRQIIKEHGLTLTLKKDPARVYNNDTGKLEDWFLLSGTWDNSNVWVDEISYPDFQGTDFSVRGYFYDYTPDMIDGNSILRGDRRLVLDCKLINGTNTPEPDATDQIIGLGDTVNIVKVMEIKSGSATMCYLLQVRE